MDTRLHIGTFELTGRVGAGGMAEVWRAEHAALGTTVAVKVITGTRALDPRYHERFTQEVQAVARLNHPGIVRVYDYGKVEGKGGHGIRNGSPYLVMELADAGTVEDQVPNDFPSLRRVLLQVLDALAYSHARGVVHRDIKPGNVLLTSGQDGVLRAKLTDFGIAHADDPDTDTDRGQLNEATGTPDYMPPEQLQGRWRDFGPWTDLYALGCMAWEIATGAVPFQGKSPIQIAVAHLSEPLPEFAPRFDVPARFVDWLTVLLAKDPRERFERAADAAFMLGRMERVPSGQWDSPNSKAFIPERWGTDSIEDLSYDDEDETTMMMQPRNTDWEPQSEVFEAADDETTVLSFTDMSWMEQSAEQPELAKPPVPSDWRRDQGGTSAVVAGMGLGLFGLREIPFVGREDERDVVWSALREATSRQAPRVVVINGRSGTGKSRLVQWITERAEEVGAASSMRAVHGAVESHKHGLPHMLERYFVTWRLDDFEKIRIRVQDELQRLWVDDGDASLEFLDHEARALATIAGRDVDGSGQEVIFASAEERLACVQRVVRRVALRRPLILWIDDAQWAEESLHLVERILENNQIPALILLTVQADAEPDDGAQKLIDSFLRKPTTQRLRLDFLEPDHQLELVQKLAGLEQEAAMRVVEATDGNPLFAVQLVGHWVEQGSLIPSHRGFLVAEGADLPREIHSLWRRRVDDIVARFGGEAQLVALELAATLGDDVVDVEWQGTCFYADVEPHERLIDELVDQGLASRFEGGFSFIHKLLSDNIRREAAKRGVARDLHSICAEVLTMLYERNPARVLERLAGHRLQAGDLVGALEPLEAVARQELASGDLVAAKHTLRKHREALDALGVDGFDRRRVENWLLSGMLCMRAGNPAEAELEFQRVMNVASPQRWRHPVALAQRGLGELAAHAGRLDEALEAYTRAEGYFGADAEPNELATIYEARAEVFKALGNTASAIGDLERALDLHRASGDSIQEVNVYSRLAGTLLVDGDTASAREVAEMGIELGRQLGNRSAEAGCWTTLGEIERFANNLDYAGQCYAEAERLDDLSGARHVWVVRTHMAMLEIAAHAWDDAVDRLAELERRLPAVGFAGMLPVIRLGRAACHAAVGEWAEFDRLWARSIADGERAGLVERDIAWLAELCGNVCARAGAAERSTIAFQVAIKNWDALGELWKARELRAKVRL